MLVRQTKIYLQGLGSVGVEPPIGVMASLINVKDKRLLCDFIPSGAFAQDLLQVALQQSEYHFTDVVFETIPRDDNSCARTLRTMLDQLANAADMPESPHFDEAGNYTLHI